MVKGGMFFVLPGRQLPFIVATLYVLPGVIVLLGVNTIENVTVPAPLLLMLFVTLLKPGLMVKEHGATILSSVNKMSAFMLIFVIVKETPCWLILL